MAPPRYAYVYMYDMYCLFASVRFNESLVFTWVSCDIGGIHYEKERHTHVHTHTGIVANDYFDQLIRRETPVSEHFLVFMPIATSCILNQAPACYKYKLLECIVRDGLRKLLWQPIHDSKKELWQLPLLLMLLLLMLQPCPEWKSRRE